MSAACAEESAIVGWQKVEGLLAGADYARQVARRDAVLVVKGELVVFAECTAIAEGLEDVVLWTALAENADCSG